MTKVFVALFLIALATPVMVATPVLAQNVGAIVASQTSSVAAAALADGTSSTVQSVVAPSREPAQGDTQQ